MLDTFMVLALLGALAVVGCLMGFFGCRYFRPFAFLVGFCGGVAVVMFLMGRLASSVSLTSLPALLAAGGVGILLGILCMLFRSIGLAISGIAAGLSVGSGLVFCADYLLQGLIPPIIYTFLSVLIASIIALSCLARPNTGKALSTSLLGGFAVVSAIAMVVAWFASQRGELAQLLSASDSLLTDVRIIVDAMSDKTLALYVVSCILLGIAMFALQSPYIEQAEMEPGIDEMEDEPFEQIKEGVMDRRPRQRDNRDKRENKEKREKKERREKKKRRRRRFSEEADFNEEFEEFDDFIDDTAADEESGEAYDDDYDEDYAELDAMIAEGVDDPEQLAESNEPDEEEETDEPEQLEDEEQEAEVAFSTEKTTYTADGNMQPAHGPLRPRSLPDENGFVEKAVAVDPSEVEEPTVVFAAIVDDEQPEPPEEQPDKTRPSRDGFSANKPTFKREKSLAEEMDYKPQGGFSSRTARNKKRK